MNDFKLVTIESPYDSRTIIHDLASPIVYTKGGYSYLPEDILNQHKVGICTCISLIQNVKKATGKSYSPDFQYLLLKKFTDGNWIEGSCIFNSLKTGKKYGFLPVELFTYITEDDRLLPYEQYIEKLQAIPDTEITRLLALCEKVLTGYAQVDVSSKENIAHAVDSSKSGILCRYAVGSEWWTSPSGQVSWNPADIDPLRPPVNVVSGHAINLSSYDYTSSTGQILANSWGTGWCKQGNADIDYSKYTPTEAWVPYYDINTAIISFTKNLQIGSQGNEVKILQQTLQKLGFFPQGQACTGYFGSITVKAVKLFQSKNNIQQTGTIGPITRAALNKLNTTTMSPTDIINAPEDQILSPLLPQNLNTKKELWSAFDTFITVFGMSIFPYVSTLDFHTVTRALIFSILGVGIRAAWKATREKYLP